MSDKPMQSRSPAALVARWIWLALVFIMAVGLALIMLMALGSFAMGEELRDGYQPQGELGPLVEALSLMFGGATFLHVLTPTLTILPAFIVALLGEIGQIRSSLYYIVAGGLSLVALPVLASPAGTPFDSHFMAIFATAGFAGGALYWLLAGRKA